MSRRPLPSLLFALLLALLPAGPALAASPAYSAAQAMAMMWEMMRWFFGNGANPAASSYPPWGWGSQPWSGGWGSQPWSYGLGAQPWSSGFGSPWSQGGTPWGGAGWPGGSGWPASPAGSSFSPWAQGGAPATGGFGGPWESGRGSGGGIEGTWRSAAGELLAIDKGRFALSAGGRGMTGLLEQRGDHLRAVVPSAGVAQEYRFLEGNGLLVLVDPTGRSITFQRVR